MVGVVIVLVFVALGGLSVWGSISFWTDGKYRRNRPPPTLSGFRVDEQPRGGDGAS